MSAAAWAFGLGCVLSLASVLITGIVLDYRINMRLLKEIDRVREEEPYA